MVDEKLSRVMVYLQTHRDPIQAEFLPLARLNMGMLPTKGDVIDVMDYVFSDMNRHFNTTEQVLRVDTVAISYQRDGNGKREIVSVCGTSIARPRFL